MPVFYPKHHREVARLLGELDRHDSIVQDLTEEFGKFFQTDNENFNFGKFQSMVTRVREGGYRRVDR